MPGPFIFPSHPPDHCLLFFLYSKRAGNHSRRTRRTYFTNLSETQRTIHSMGSSGSHRPCFLCVRRFAKRTPGDFPSTISCHRSRAVCVGATGSNDSFDDGICFTSSIRPPFSRQAPCVCPFLKFCLSVYLFIRRPFRPSAGVWI